MADGTRYTIGPEFAARKNTFCRQDTCDVKTVDLRISQTVPIKPHAKHGFGKLSRKKCRVKCAVKKRKIAENCNRMRGEGGDDETVCNFRLISLTHYSNRVFQVIQH